MASIGSTKEFNAPDPTEGPYVVLMNIDTDTGVISVGVSFPNGGALVSADSTVDQAIARLNKVLTIANDKNMPKTAGIIGDMKTYVTSRAAELTTLYGPKQTTPAATPNVPAVIAPASPVVSLGSVAAAAATISGAGVSLAGSATTAIANTVTGKLGGALGGAVKNALNKALGISAPSADLGAGVKNPTATSTIPNPMHQFASWTYAVSLWWLDTADLNALADNPDAGFGTNYKLSSKSYVIAEDSGLYPNQRLPTQNGLNYTIQSIEFDTVVGLNSKSKSSNMVSGNMMIVEPYGMTLLDTLVKQSRQSDGTYHSHTAQPYMIQIDFVGYDDNGDPAPTSQTNIYRKRFPINIRGFGIESTRTGSEYKLEFTALNHITHDNVHSSIPKNFTVSASTVGEFFDSTRAGSFTDQLNQFWLTEQVEKKTVEYADSIKFDIDPAIAKSKIIYSNQMSLSQSNPNSNQIDLSTGNFSIPAGTQIQEIINKVLIQSDYLQKQLIDPTNLSNDQIRAEMTKILNTFKTVVGVRYAGAQSYGAKKDNAFDNIRNDYAKEFKYSILQYSVYNAAHPSAPQASDSTPFSVKSYNYTYTGQNIDVLDLKMKFDSTFFNVVNTYTKEVAASRPSQSTASDDVATTSAQTPLALQWLGKIGILPNANKTATLTPQRIKPIVADQRENTGMNIIANPGSQNAASVLRSIYSNDIGSSMASIDLSIVGDPTMLKQDDFLYTPGTDSTKYNLKNSQADFAKQFGHIRMDNGELIASVTVNSPVDIDIDGANEGLMSPKIGTVPSLFSGQYKIIKIKNMFNNGQFTQMLSMIRLTNDLIAQNTKSSTNTSRTNTTKDYSAYTGAIPTDKVTPTNLRPTLQNDPRRVDQ